MTDQVATTYDEKSLSAELDQAGVAPSAEASSSESQTATEGELPGAALGGAEDVAADLPSRLAGRMGSEHTTWTFADPSDAQAWAQASFAFCADYCPRQRHCPGEECRLHRFERQALEHLNA
jgi:hypothetical protein